MIKDFLRVLLGIRPYVYRVILSYAAQTSSYHVRFSGPDDQYVSRLEVDALTNRKPSHHAPVDNDVAERGSYLVVSQSDDSATTSFRHVYVRPLAVASGETVEGPTELVLRVGLRERPPGLIGLALLIGAIQIMTQAVVLWKYDAIFPGSGNADIAALLLAFPAIVSGWIANQIGPGRLQRMPLAAVIGVVTNGVGAITATLFALLAAERVEAVNPTWHVGRVPLTHGYWLVLLAIEVIVFWNLAYRWMQGTLIYYGRWRRERTMERYAV
ncbi:MAG TPA: hypothetical protein VKT78_01010 [Fimbriimonadaceae bacterium]|nr:hypothetical protein [Fimbriimonadaceae bacterium]